MGLVGDIVRDALAKAAAFRQAQKEREQNVFGSPNLAYGNTIGRDLNQQTNWSIGSPNIKVSATGGSVSGGGGGGGGGGGLGALSGMGAVLGQGGFGSKGSSVNNTINFGTGAPGAKGAGVGAVTPTPSTGTLPTPTLPQLPSTPPPPPMGGDTNMSSTTSPVGVAAPPAGGAAPAVTNSGGPGSIAGEMPGWNIPGMPGQRQGGGGIFQNTQSRFAEIGASNPGLAHLLTMDMPGVAQSPAQVTSTEALFRKLRGEQ